MLLQRGVSIERTLEDADRHTYDLDLTAGEYASLIVDQEGVDLRITVDDPSGQATFDDEPRPQGREHVIIVAGAASRFRVIVARRYPKHDSGRYALWIDDSRPATDRDRALYQSRQLYTEAAVLSSGGKFDDALAKSSKALTLAESAVGANDAYVAAVLTMVATHQRSKGLIREAEETYQRAILISDATLGHEHPVTGLRMELLGAMLNAEDDYARAESLITEGTAIVQRTLADSPTYAGCLRDLARLHQNRGDYERALVELQQAMQVADRTLPADDSTVIGIANNLGDLYLTIDDYDRALPLLERALHGAEQVFGPDNYRVAIPLLNLSILARHRGDFGLAFEYARRAYAIREKAFGKEHTLTAAIVIVLGNIHHERKEYQEALDAYRAAQDVLERTAGPYHSYTLMAINNATHTYLSEGDLPDALRSQEQFAARLDKTITFNMAIGSEREKLAYIQTTLERMSQAVSLHLRYAPENSEAADLAAAAILRHKGRVLDALSRNREGLRARMQPDDRKLLDDFAAVTRKLSQIALNGPGRTPYAQFQQQLADFEVQREDLERQISARSSEFRVDTQRVTPASIREPLSEEAAIVEFAVYRPFDPNPGAGQEAYGAPRYAAYVIRRHAETRGVDLGPADGIDAAISRMREALRDPSRSDIVKLARSLDEFVLRPVRALAGNARQLLIAPDGALNLVPFEALVDERGRYQVERYAITYLGTARDVLRMQVPRGSAGPPIVVADPAFGEPSPSRAATAPRGDSAAPNARAYFAPLVGTAQEASAIGRLLPGARVLTGRDATKEALTHVRAPSVLHIASHAFFLPTGNGGPRSTSPGARSMTMAVSSQNPLLRSGIALAGANLSSPSGDDGIITALEASTLNLWGTRLVTLSACDTGVGDVITGEGVYGLRRAFFLAGTETLVMTLWPVSDYVTRIVMTRYYTALAHGEGRREALRRVQLAMLADKGHRHPFYWAGFIQAGDWTPIR